MKIFMTGSTGNVGSRVVEELRRRQADVRVLVRKKSVSTAPSGVEVVIGDLLDPVSVENAIDGVDKLFLVNAVVSDELTQCLIAYDLAKKQNLLGYAPRRYEDFARETAEKWRREIS